MTKKEIIAAAYGKYCNEVTPDEDGWINFRSAPDKWLREAKFEGKTVSGERYLRPKALDQIVNNNGWTKITTIEDLPKLEDDIVIFRLKTGTRTTWPACDVIEDPKWFLRYSHWRTVEKTPEPIY